MSNWNAMTYDAKDTILRVVRQEAAQFFALVDSEEAWERPTGAGHWQVRDIVGHLVDTTEAYFVAFDAARSRTEIEPAYGLPGMAARVDRQAQAFGREPRAALVDRLRTDFDKMMEIFEALTEEDWSVCWSRTSTWARCRPSSTRPSSSWTTACTPGTSGRAPAEPTALRRGRRPAHAVHVRALEVHRRGPASSEPCTLGIRICQRPQRRRHTRHRRTRRDGLRAPGTSPTSAAVLEFDPGSFVLTAFGRSNAGTIRGDRAVADRYLNLFFRI